MSISWNHLIGTVRGDEFVCYLDKCQQSVQTEELKLVESMFYMEMKEQEVILGRIIEAHLYCGQHCNAVVCVRCQRETALQNTMIVITAKV